ncbi:TPA: flagellar basal body P-ring formation protein FlgA [bacterium]|nr:flagellar basal body P-ring formation protein FlgA [bacterium]
MFRQFLLSIIFYLIILAVVTNADEYNSITIPENPIVNGKEIYLGDIASISVSDVAESRKLSKVHICQSAKPGASITLNIGYIKSRAKQQGVSIDSLIWNTPNNIVIETSSRIVSFEEVKIAGENFFKNLVSKNAIVNAQPAYEMRPIILPDGDIDIKVESVSKYPVNGNFSLNFIFSIDGCECEKRLIPFKVEVIDNVVVSAKQIDLNSVIKEDDLIITSKDIGLSSDVFYKKDDIIGKNAKKNISKGSFITSDMIKQVPIIKQGDLITILVESASLKISTQGKAMENGIKDQVIRIINISSLKELQAQVVDKNTVKINL